MTWRTCGKTPLTAAHSGAPLESMAIHDITGESGYNAGRCRRLLYRVQLHRAREFQAVFKRDRSLARHVAALTLTLHSLCRSAGSDDRERHRGTVPRASMRRFKRRTNPTI